MSEHFGVTPDTTVLGKFMVPIVAVIADPALDVAPDLSLGDYTHKETVGVLLTLPLSLVPALTLMPLIGLALNGTSSALYGTVAEFVTPERRARAFGLFSALGTFASAISPAIYGVISDVGRVPVALATVDMLVLTTIPLARLLRRSLSQQLQVASNK